jgi:hypothetical protein
MPAVNEDQEMQTHINLPGPLTRTLRAALGGVTDDATIADLLFLERWEIQPLPGAAAALRVVQIRRANPALAAALRAEVATIK